MNPLQPPFLARELEIRAQEAHKMTTDLVLAQENLPPAFASRPFPAVILQAGPEACRHFVEFFTANIRNANTRKAYARAVAQFLEWCDARGLALGELRPFHVAAYVEELPKRPSHERSVTRKARNGRSFGAITEIQPLEAPSVKQHLAAIRMLFDWLVVGQGVPYKAGHLGAWSQACGKARQDPGVVC